jgi:carboxymethylenebutenolidase
MFRRPLSIALLLGAAACSVQQLRPPQASDDHMSHMSAADLRAPVVQAGSVARQGTPGIPASNNTAPARLAASPRHGEWVKFALTPGSKDSIMAWVVFPQSRAKAPVVVVVHEIFGLSTWVRGVADQVAADGFIAVAPDFLSLVRPGGPSTTELPGTEATALIRGPTVTTTFINQVITGAANYGMMLPAAEQRYAVIGYCWGGSASWDQAINGGVKGFAGAVPFYGTPYTSGGGRATATTPATPTTVNIDSLKKINVPVMLLSGSNDTRITALMPQIDSAMKALGKNYSGTNYPGASHGFLRQQDDPHTGRDGSPDTATQAADIAAAKDAWPKTIAFLKKNLGVK